MSANIDEIKQYRPAQLRCGKRWYVEFYAYNPEKKKLHRKTIKLNHISKITERRKYATHIINEINIKLRSGWNPFVNSENSKQYKRFSEVVSHFKNNLFKEYKSGVKREDTYKRYLSSISVFEKWIIENYSDLYIYQLSKEIAVNFLDYIYITKDVSALTRNNNLTFLKIFANFLVQKSYQKTKFTQGIEAIPLHGHKKFRQVITDTDRVKIWDYFRQENKHYLLACKIAYYMQIRPRELSYCRLNWFNISKSTCTIPDDVSKNRKTETITLPDVVVKYMIELEVFNFPNDYFLFSENFMPGPEYKKSARFRYYWLKMRKALKMPDYYQFYSQKDTGITHTIKSTGDVQSARLQARHSDLSITSKYTPNELKESDKKIKGLK